jgi:membrane associated rhomboid family serine protease
MPSLSRAGIAALCGCAAIVLLQAIAAAPAALEYRAGLWLIEPWRLLGAHLVHVNWPHALVNGAAWWLVVRLFGGELGVLRQAIVLACAALAIDAGLAVLYPAIAWYRGASGVLHGLFFAGALLALLAPRRRADDGAGYRADDRADDGADDRADDRADDGSDDAEPAWRTRGLPALLLIGGAIKVVLEQPQAADTPFADWLGATTVPQAHWLGAVGGSLAGAAMAARRALARRPGAERGFPLPRE